MDLKTVSRSLSASTVSVVIPNYNHAAVIARSIGCLQKQTRPVDEIIVVDDGSTDDSVAVIERLQASDTRIKLIRHKCNRGAVSAINTGLAVTSGSFVHFAAADDAFRPELIATTLAMLEVHESAALACGEIATFHSPDGTPMGFRPPARPSSKPAAFSPTDTAQLLKRIDNFIVTAATLFRREHIVAEGGFDESLNSFTDGYLVRRLALTHGFCYVPQVLAEWWIDDKGYSRSTAKDAARGLALLETICARQRRDPAFPAWYPDYFTRRWKFAAMRVALQSSPPDYRTLHDMMPDPLTGATLKLAQWFPSSLARLFLLVILTLRWRPTSIPALLRTWLDRQWAST
jgi:glycosyltransferase involved in cell wall biosynthesis